MCNTVVKAFAVSFCLFGSMSVYAAKAVELDNQPVSFLNSYVSQPAVSNLRAATIKSDEVKEVRRATDSNNTTHIRIQQYHAGVPVWGADSVVHVPATRKRMAMNLASVSAAPGSTMNGMMYQNLETDLAATQQLASSAAQTDKAKNKALELARDQYGKGDAKVLNQQLMVYVDENNNAHWAFLVSIYMKHTGKNLVTVKPTFILDAVTFDTYKSWNDIKTIDSANGGGLGGNKRTGQLIYDGLQSDLAALSIERDAKNVCHLRNEDVMIFDGRTIDYPDDDFDSRKFVPAIPEGMSYPCDSKDPKHNNVYWNGSMDPVNGAFSPANDALFAGSVVQSLYKQWYNQPMLKNRDGSPMQLKMYVHYYKDWENAEWDDVKSEIHLGDGADWAYPLTALDVVAHEVSHGFTSQHSDLVYADQSGSINESFSDMAGMAAEVFATGTTNWQIGAQTVKEEGAALRYVDQPSKDCRAGDKAGSGCSIDSADQYNYLVRYGRVNLHLFGDQLQSYIVHLASGVYNHAFYYLATSPGWDVKKAFAVMVHANSYYWTKTATFKSGACGAVKAARDLKYDVDAVTQSFKKVGIDTKGC